MAPNTHIDERKKQLQVMLRWIGAAMMLVAIGGSFIARAADLPPAKTGGVGGGPVSVLFLANPTGFQTGAADSIDAKYKEDLLAAGYRVTELSVTQKITPEYLSHFGVVVLSGLPFAGEKYNVGGDIFESVNANLKALKDYVQSGGGLIVEPSMSEFGEAYADTYNRFLKPFDIRILPQQLRDDQSLVDPKSPFAVGIIQPAAPIGEGLTQVNYPIRVMRWDNAYSTTPLIAGKDWSVVARGKDSAGSHQAVDNELVGPRLTDNRAIYAFRKFDKGYIAVSGIHAYYTMTRAYSKEANAGENATGVIDGAVLRGIGAEHKSDYGALLDQTFRVFAANSAMNAMGGGEAKIDLAKLPDDPHGAIDWHTAKPPPTWQHRLITTQDGYRTQNDPEAAGELKYFKILVGPRTALSSGKGSVKEYRDAAQKAGYAAIAFCETFADIDPAKWDAFVADCDANTDETFACLPGFDIKDFQGGRYLVLDARRFPDPSWLTKDHKRLEATRMLSLGWYGQVASVHRGTTDNALSYKMYKQHQAITVYTYDAAGKLVDDSLKAYEWSIQSDSNPIPIAAHELTDPSQVATAMTAGFQQIMPAPTVAAAIDYFKFAFPHYFDCPLRYFISEGPVLNGWSILNKDLGPAERGEDHFRLAVGVKSDQPIAEVKLFDGFEQVDRWLPKANNFQTEVTGSHNEQHEFMLMATDAAGRRVLSPGIRTTTQNWRLRCGDRQNWLGSFWIYTGWNLNGIPYFELPLKENPLQPIPIFDYTFFSNHVQLAEADLSYKYVNTYGQDVGGDAKPTYAVTPSDRIEGHERTIYFSPPKRQDFGVLYVDGKLKLRQEIRPAYNSGVFPQITDAGPNKLAILPNQQPVTIDEKTKLNLPIGSYAGGIIPLSDGFRIEGNQIGLAAPAGVPASLPAGTAWEAKYLILKSSTFHWRNTRTPAPADAVAEKALEQMGFRGMTPYSFELQSGKLDKLAYFADLTADHGAISGAIKNDRSEALLYDIPLRIAGLNGRCETILWRSDSPALTYFACYDDHGYVPLNADKSVAFYAGVAANCDPALSVSVVIWNANEALFEVRNPTDHDITTDFATPAAIKGFRAIHKSITIPAGGETKVVE